jgi:hypothetical protein
MGTQQGATGVAEDARDHPALGWPARLGFVAYGFVYVVVAWLAVQLGTGDRAGAVSGEGALQEVAQQPLGAVALWVAAAALLAVSVWEACQAVAGHRDRDGTGRVWGRLGSAGRAIVFAALGVTAAQVALGDGGGKGTDSYTAQLMRLPFGPWLVAAVGLAIAGYGVFSVVKGLTDKWRKELDIGGRTGHIGTVVTVLARVGFTARGVAFIVIGGLFVWAAATQDPEQSGGLDQALARLREAPLGPALLVGVAVGLACYGVFNVAKAWHLRTT